VRLLVLGGTAFLGRHLSERALERGHRLTLFNRGQTNPGLFP
jgi:2'-hydroxyisoflavone reductase